MTVKFSVLYPKTEGATFDHDYYANSHVPLAVTTWGLDGAEIDKGIDGPYEAAVHFTFDSTEAIGAALGSPRHRRRSWPTWPTTRPSCRSPRPARSSAEPPAPTLAPAAEPGEPPWSRQG